MSSRNRSIRLWFAVLAVMTATGAAAQPVKPPVDFTPCTTCHEVTPDGENTGPTLFGVVGRKAATVPDFDYSPAMKAWGQNWTPENIQAYILNPSKFMPGNKMDYDGAPDAATAKAIVDYLKTLKP